MEDIKHDELIKEISNLKLDIFNTKDEEQRTEYYIDSLKKEQEKCKDDKEKQERYEKEINDAKNEFKNKTNVFYEAKNDFEDKTRVFNENKPKLDEKTVKQLNKLQNLIDIIEDLTNILKIESIYEPVEKDFDKIFLHVLPPTIHWKDELVLTYNKKDQEQFLIARSREGDEPFTWKKLLDEQTKIHKTDTLTFCKIRKQDYDEPLFIKEGTMLYSLFLFPLFNQEENEDDKFHHVIRNIFSECYNKRYSINILNYSWRIDPRYRHAIMYIKFDGSHPK